jgi:hypothetical protein
MVTISETAETFFPRTSAKRRHSEKTEVAQKPDAENEHQNMDMTHHVRKCSGTATELVV